MICRWLERRRQERERREAEEEAARRALHKARSYGAREVLDKTIWDRRIYPDHTGYVDHDFDPEHGNNPVRGMLPAPKQMKIKGFTLLPEPTIRLADIAAMGTAHYYFDIGDKIYFEAPFWKLLPTEFRVRFMNGRRLRRPGTVFDIEDLLGEKIRFDFPAVVLDIKLTIPMQQNFRARAAALPALSRPTAFTFIIDGTEARSVC